MTPEVKTNRKAKPGGRPILWNLARNWLHQAMTYMDTGERSFRVAIELLEISVLAFVFLSVGVGHLTSILGACVLVHTFNWITNGLFWSVMLFSFPNMRNAGEYRTCEYLNKMTERLKGIESISGLALYGSVSRGQWHERSDIDMRILRKPGFGNLISAAACMMRERFIALLHKQPMDMYLADGTDYLLKMRADENPIFLIKRDVRLDVLYPGNPETVLQRLHT
jgi:predicted nucleotidyltransferase